MENKKYPWDSYPEWHNGDDTVIAQRAAFRY